MSAMQQPLISTIAIERTAIALAAAAALFAGAVVLLPRARPPEARGSADARRRLAAARAILEEPDPTAATRFDLMIDSLAAGVPSDTPAALGPWIDRIRVARRDSAGALASESVSKALAGAERELSTLPTSRARLRRTLGLASGALAIGALLLAHVALARARALKRRLSMLVGVVGRSSERELVEAVALALATLRARSNVSALRPVPGTIAAAAGPSMGVPPGRLSDVTVLEDHP